MFTSFHHDSHWYGIFIYAGQDYRALWQREWTNIPVHWQIVIRHNWYQRGIWGSLFRVYGTYRHFSHLITVCVCSVRFTSLPLLRKRETRVTIKKKPNENWNNFTWPVFYCNCLVNKIIQIKLNCLITYSVHSDFPSLVNAEMPTLPEPVSFFYT